MDKITNQLCLELLTNFDNHFKEIFINLRMEWGNDEPGLCIILGKFSHYVSHNIDLFTAEYLKELFNIIENLIEFGFEDVSNSICTCFLENLQNRSLSSSGNFDFKKIVDYLGIKSKEFCINWDKFTGIKTEGLYHENE